MHHYIARQRCASQAKKGSHTRLKAWIRPPLKGRLLIQGNHEKGVSIRGLCHGTTDSSTKRCWKCRIKTDFSECCPTTWCSSDRNEAKLSSKVCWCRI